MIIGVISSSCANSTLRSDVDTFDAIAETDLDLLLPGWDVGLDCLQETPVPILRFPFVIVGGVEMLVEKCGKVVGSDLFPRLGRHKFLELVQNYFPPDWGGLCRGGHFEAFEVGNAGCFLMAEVDH